MRNFKQINDNVKALRRKLEEAGKKVDIGKQEVKIACVHKDANGILSFERTNKTNPYTGRPLIRCKECGAEIDIGAIEEDELNACIDTINRLCELSKMYLKIESDADIKMLMTINDIHNKNIRILPQLYKSIRKKRDKRKNSEDSNIKKFFG